MPIGHSSGPPMTITMCCMTRRSTSRRIGICKSMGKEGVVCSSKRRGVQGIHWAQASMLKVQKGSRVASRPKCYLCNVCNTAADVGEGPTGALKHSRVP